MFQPEEDSLLGISEPPQIRRLKAVNRLSIYGFWFLLGVAIANLSRLIPTGWIIYWVAMLGVGGFMIFAATSDGDVEEIATRRIAGFAFFLSCTAFWDCVVALANLPVHILSWILPVWQCLLLGIFGLIACVIFIGLVAT